MQRVCSRAVLRSHILCDILSYVNIHTDQRSCCFTILSLRCNPVSAIALMLQQTTRSNVMPCEDLIAPQFETLLWHMLGLVTQSAVLSCVLSRKGTCFVLYL